MAIGAIAGLAGAAGPAMGGGTESSSVTTGPVSNASGSNGWSFAPAPVSFPGKGLLAGLPQWAQLLLMLSLLLLAVGVVLKLVKG